MTNSLYKIVVWPENVQRLLSKVRPGCKWEEIEHFGRCADIHTERRDVEFYNGFYYPCYMLEMPCERREECITPQTLWAQFKADALAGKISLEK